MIRPILLVLALIPVLLVPRQPVRADKETVPPQKPKGTILVRFHDGGLMHMSFAGDYINVTTKHGKLKIAVSDIRQLELATRIPPEMQTEINNAIRDLADKDFKVREAAMKTLTRHRERAYPELLEVARHPDMEVQNRAKQLIDRLRESTSEEKLRFRVHDVIHTDDSIITGKIEADMIEVDTVQFGKLNLKLQDAWNIVFVGNGTVSELKLDGRYAIQTEVWLDTKLDFFSGTFWSLKADGEIDLYATVGYTGQYVGTPRGKKAWPGSTGLPQEPGTLMGKIGRHGTPFVIGDNFEGRAREDGRLYLRAAGNPYNVQTSGEYTIRITGGIPAR